MLDSFSSFLPRHLVWFCWFSCIAVFGFFLLFFFSSPTPFTQCPLHFLPTLPNSTFLLFSHAIWCGLFCFLVLWFYGWLVWLFCFLVLWCLVCFVFMGFLLPHSPSVPSTFFYPSLKLPYPPQSFGAGISESDEK